MTFTAKLTCAAAAFMVGALVLSLLPGLITALILVGLIAALFAWCACAITASADQSLDEWADEAAYGDAPATATFSETTILDFARPAAAGHNAHDGGAAGSFHGAPLVSDRKRNNG